LSPKLFRPDLHCRTIRPAGDLAGTPVGSRRDTFVLEGVPKRAVLGIRNVAMPGRAIWLLAGIEMLKDYFAAAAGHIAHAGCAGAAATPGLPSGRSRRLRHKSI